MTDAAKKILAQIEELPEEEQDLIVETLVERRRAAGDVGELSEEWKQEIARRIEQLRSGEVTPIPGTEVEARLRASLERVRRARGDD